MVKMPRNKDISTWISTQTQSKKQHPHAHFVHFLLWCLCRLATPPYQQVWLAQELSPKSSSLSQQGISMNYIYWMHIILCMQHAYIYIFITVYVLNVIYGEIIARLLQSALITHTHLSSCLVGSFNFITIKSIPRIWKWTDIMVPMI